MRAWINGLLHTTVYLDYVIANFWGVRNKNYRQSFKMKMALPRAYMCMRSYKMTALELIASLINKLVLFFVLVLAYKLGKISARVSYKLTDI